MTSILFFIRQTVVYKYFVLSHVYDAEKPMLRMMVHRHTNLQGTDATTKTCGHYNIHTFVCESMKSAVTQQPSNTDNRMAMPFIRHTLLQAYKVHQMMRLLGSPYTMSRQPHWLTIPGVIQRNKMSVNETRQKQYLDGWTCLT